MTPFLTMGSARLPVIADFYMEKFERVALDTAPYMPSFYKRYVDDTLLGWTLGIDRLN